jgi:shikimate kinase
MTAGSAPARVLLVGMMGCGKSTTGRGVARRLGWTYSDSDELVERDTGRSVEALWAEHGEPGFRTEESRVLAEALAEPGPSVISVAGGAVLDPDNRDLIAGGGLVVWLRATVSTLVRRVGPTGEGRPLLRDDPPQVLASLDAVRRPIYAALADVVIDVDDRSPDEVVDQVVAAAQAHHVGDAGVGP